jgi:hypothetical protein
LKPDLASGREVSRNRAITHSEVFYVALDSKVLKPIVYSPAFHEAAIGEVDIEQGSSIAPAKILQSGFQRGKFAGRKCGTD